MPVTRVKKIKLYNALRLGYLRDERRQRKRLKKFGYRLDANLTTRDHLVAYNPTTNKVIFVSNGTQLTSPSDIYTDVGGIGLGRLRETDRFKRDNAAYLKAKDTYKDAPVTLVGHSLGGAIISAIDLKANDKAIGYNSAVAFNKPKENLKLFRTVGDPFSAFSRDTRSLANQASLVERGNPLQPHAVSNIRNQPIFVG